MKLNENLPSKVSGNVYQQNILLQNIITNKVNSKRSLSVDRTANINQIVKDNY